MKQTLLLLLALICLNAKAATAEPIMTMTTDKSLGQTISFSLRANVANTVVKVDFGDGNLVDKTIGTSLTTISGTLVSSYIVKIYGTGINFLACYTNQLTKLDVSKNTALTDLICYNNKLTSLDVTNNTILNSLSCSWNQLASLNVTKNTALTYIDCISNQLTSLNVTNNTALTSIDCSSNLLTLLDVTKNTALTGLWCSSNEFTFASLPLIKPTTFVYAPQNAIAIATSFAVNTPIDLSSQLSVNNTTTTYTWKTESGTTLTAGIDYTIEGGITTFTTLPTGKVYCEMTNGTFPAFTGTKVLKTTLTTIGTATAVENTPAAASLVLYPNPCTDGFNVSGIDAPANVTITDLTGRVVIKTMVDVDGVVPVSHLTQGTYLVKVNQQVLKLIKK